MGEVELELEHDLLQEQADITDTNADNDSTLLFIIIIHPKLGEVEVKLEHALSFHQQD